VPAEHKVSVAWQIVALFIPVANFWAFYRIRKLRKYLLYAYVPSVVLSVVSIWVASRSIYFINDTSIGLTGTSPYDFVPWYQTPYIAGGIVGVALLVFSIYLVIKWSREHNQKYEARPNTS
jgi:hypothetical protein